MQLTTRLANFANRFSIICRLSVGHQVSPASLQIIRLLWNVDQSAVVPVLRGVGPLVSPITHQVGTCLYRIEWNRNIYIAQN